MYVLVPPLPLLQFGLFIAAKVIAGDVYFFLHNLQTVLVQDFGEDCSSESESDDDAESAEEYASESEVDDVTDAANEEEWASSGEARSEASDDERDAQASAEALKKLVPYNLEDFEKVILLNKLNKF